MSLKDINIGAFMGEIALWGRNLTDDDEVSYMLNLAGLGVTGNYPEDRIYGIDLSLKY